MNSEDYSGGVRFENTLDNLRPGRYRVSAVVRADKTMSGHSGMIIYAKANDKTVNKMARCFLNTVRMISKGSK